MFWKKLSAYQKWEISSFPPPFTEPDIKSPAGRLGCMTTAPKWDFSSATSNWLTGKPGKVHPLLSRSSLHSRKEIGQCFENLRDEK